MRFMDWFSPLLFLPGAIRDIKEMVGDAKIGLPALKKELDKVVENDHMMLEEIRYLREDFNGLNLKLERMERGIDELADKEGELVTKADVIELSKTIKPKRAKKTDE